MRVHWHQTDKRRYEMHAVKATSATQQLCNTHLVRLRFVVVVSGVRLLLVVLLRPLHACSRTQLTV